MPPFSQGVLVSVVMSVYNGARFLDEAVLSILNQTYTNFEFVIIDDGSTDNTAEKLAKYAQIDSRVRVLSQQNSGLIAALHRGFAEARGTYIARMDADDVSKLDRLEKQIHFFGTNPRAALVGGAVEFIDTESRPSGTVWLPTEPEDLRRDLRNYGNAIAHPTVMFHRRALEAVGGFRKAYLHAEDYDLWLRMMENFDLANLRAVLLGYRRHGANVSIKNARQQALSALCARVTAKLRLEGKPDPTGDLELITEKVLLGLGVSSREINEAIFKNLVTLTEEMLLCGFLSAAAEFVRLAHPYASSDELKHRSLMLNKKAASLPGSESERRRHRSILLMNDPQIYWAVFMHEIHHPDRRPATPPNNPPQPVEFSVLMPVYNHSKYVEQAIRSAMRSTLVREVIVIDDGSVDGSVEIIGALATEQPTKICYITTKKHENRGAPERLNELVKLARSPWVAILNSDDVFVDGRFEVITGHPCFTQSDFVFGNLLFINSGGALLSAKRGPFDPGRRFPRSFDVNKMMERGDYIDLLAHQNYLGTTSNMVFTKALHAAVGGFANFRYVHDWDFGLRAMALGRCLYIPKYLTAYRVHGANTINESPTKVDTESRILFERLSADFPQLRERFEYQAAIRQNVSLVPRRFAKVLPRP